MLTEISILFILTVLYLAIRKIKTILLSMCIHSQDLFSIRLILNSYINADLNKAMENIEYNSYCASGEKGHAIIRELLNAGAKGNKNLFSIAINNGHNTDDIVETLLRNKVEIPRDAVLQACRYRKDNVVDLLLANKTFYLAEECISAVEYELHRFKDPSVVRDKLLRIKSLLEYY